MVTCTRRLTFEAGHRVLGHENKCAHPHGHSYKVWITAQADLDSLGRVIDFSVLKEKVGGWIDKYLDHAFICHVDDRAMSNLLAEQGFKRYVIGINPTAENLAILILDRARVLLHDSKVNVTKVVVQETENCTAEAVYVPKGE